MNPSAPQKYADVVRRLRDFDCELVRHLRGSHQIWICLKTGRKFVLPAHNEVAAGTLKSALKQAGIDAKEFFA